MGNWVWAKGNVLKEFEGGRRRSGLRREKSEGKCRDLTPRQPWFEAGQNGAVKQ